MNEYLKQAEDFLQKAEAKIEVKFLGHYPYFDDDKESRDVYEVTIKRGELKPWTFKFGQSIANSGKYVTRNPRGRTVYDHELIRRPAGRIKPTAYDILACMQKYDPGTFSNFCSDFGYDEDSRKAEKIYFDVQKEAAECQRVFGDMVDELNEIT